jgi:hypothetical protein
MTTNSKASSERVVQAENDSEVLRSMLLTCERERRWGKLELDLQDGLVESVRIVRTIKMRDARIAA